MANYYFSDYVFEGEKNELDEMEAMLKRLEAMKEEDFPIKDVAWGSTWLGFIVNDMGHDPKEFTTKGAWYNLKRLNENALSIHTESAWDAPDDIIDLFCEKWPSLKFYYYREQPESGIYEKNDAEDKYFPFNYILIGEVPMKDVNGEEEAIPVEERFNTQEDAFEWIAKELHHPVASIEDIEKWCEELEELEDGYFIALNEIEGLYSLDDSSITWIEIK